MTDTLVRRLRNLGIMHFTGRGLPQDYEEAVKWWLKAAAQGHAQAQGALRAWPRPKPN